MTAKRASSTPVKSRKSEEEILPIGLDIELMENSDSEAENKFPAFFNHEFNECLSLWLSDAENYIYEMGEEYSLVEKLEGTSMSNDIFKRRKKEARYLLVKNFCVASKVKLELAPEAPCIYGISAVEELEDVRIWVNKAHVDRFTLICPNHGTAC